MPSTARAPHPPPLDLEHLARMTSGEKALEREVLALFLSQTSRLIDALKDMPGEAAALSHTLKGSARAIGAFAVADRAAALEQAAREGRDPTELLASLCDAVTEARRAIEARLGRP